MVRRVVFMEGYYAGYTTSLAAELDGSPSYAEKKGLSDFSCEDFELGQTRGKAQRPA